MVFREDFLVKLFGQTRQAGRGVVSAWVHMCANDKWFIQLI